MDRREALKKLALGGSAVAGATLVVSSPAFADGGSNSARPPAPTQPTGTITKQGASGVDGFFTLPASGICPNGGQRARVDYAIQVVPITPGLTVTGTNTSYVTGAAFGSGTTTTTPTVSVTGANPKQFNIHVNIRHVCRDFQSGQPAWICRTYVFAVTTNNGGNVNLPVGVSVGSPVAPLSCDSPAPATP